MQLGFFFDQARCTGCYTCQLACKDWHDIPAGPVGWIRMTHREEGKFPRVFSAYLANTCYHCAAPPCVSVCPADAITKREADGVVVVESDVCLGKDDCQMCLEVCPYGAPQFGSEDNAKMQKCDFCLDRLREGKEPICVAACPMRALDFGPMDELCRKYGKVREVRGFVYLPQLEPAIVFRPRKALFENAIE